MEQRSEFRRFAVTLSLVSLVLHWGWEYLQCPLFFVHRSVPLTHTAMFVATVGDVGLTWMAYAVVSVSRQDRLWALRRWRRWDVILLAIACIGLALSVELVALKLGRWEYTAFNPRVPGTGLSLIPVLQLLILVPSSVRLASRMIRE